MVVVVVVVLVFASRYWLLLLRNTIHNLERPTNFRSDGRRVYYSRRKQLSQRGQALGRVHGSNVSKPVSGEVKREGRD